MGSFHVFVIVYRGALYSSCVMHWVNIRSLKVFPRSTVMTKTLHKTSMLASLETTSPMLLLAEHRYRPASSLVTAVKWSDREFSPLTKPSVMSTALPVCFHVITDTELLDTLQFSKPECVSLSCTSVVSIVGSSFEQSNIDNREQNKVSQKY